MTIRVQRYEYLTILEILITTLAGNKKMEIRVMTDIP